MNMLLLLSLLWLLLLFFIPLLMLIKHGIILIHTICMVNTHCITVLYSIHRTYRTFFNINFVLFFCGQNFFRALVVSEFVARFSTVYCKCRSFVWLLLCVLVLTHNYVELNIFNGKTIQLHGTVPYFQFNFAVFMGTSE